MQHAVPNNSEVLVPVIFRKWRDCGSVIALFPEIPSDIYGHFCEAYEHVGQHGGADYFGVIQATTPIGHEEAMSLNEELTRIGYRLKSIKRASHAVHERRRAAAREIMARQL
jgi:hypothetical protein